MAEGSHDGGPRPSWPSHDDPQERINDWLKSWDDGTLGSLEDKEPDPFLVEHFGRLSKGRQPLKIFVSMCGTCIDMKWFADHGHQVVGIDVSDVAARLFFHRYDIQHTVHDIPGIHGQVYKSTDGFIKFYVADFFLFNESVEGRFDVIWDTGALGSTHIKDRDKYMAVMNRLMKNSCIYLLEILVYDRDKFNGPPYCFYEEDIKHIFGNEFDVHRVADHDVDVPEQDAVVMEGFHEIGFQFHFYCLTRE